MSINDKQIRQARSLIVSGMSLTEAAAVMGMPTMESAIFAGLAALKARTKRYADKNWQGQKWKGNIIATNTVPVPAHVIAERDHRSTLVPRDTTAFLLGDPLPGYSMQERAPAIVPRIYRDPLDALVFGRKRSQLLAKRFDLDSNVATEAAIDLLVIAAAE